MNPLYLVLHMKGGEVEEAREAAKAGNLAVKHDPKVNLIFSIAGFDDDPRELDEIPEGRASLKALVERLENAAFLRFEPAQRAMMLVGAGIGYRRGAQFIVPDVILQEGVK